MLELNAVDITSGVASDSVLRSLARTRSTSVGLMSLPSFAMAAATIAFCNGVDSTSPWPMDASATLSSDSVSGNLAATDFIGRPDDEVPSMVIELP